MPIERVTIKTQVWRKILSCAKRDKNEELKALMSTDDWCVKTSLSPKKDTIVWAPTEKWKRLIIQTLEVELTFMRKKESAAYRFTEETIAVLRSSLPELAQE